MNFTVEVTTDPVLHDDWSKLYNALDAVPGAVLLEDADEPVLMIPVDAEEPMKAALFVDGLAKLLELTIRTGKIYPTPVDDFEVDEEDEPAQTTAVVRLLDDYVARTPDVAGHLTNDGRLVGAN